MTGVAAAGGSPHHGVQSDFLLSKDSAGYVSGATNVPLGYPTVRPAPTFATPQHYSANFKTSPTGSNDSCVTCHVTLNTQNTTGQVTSHGMYLTGATGDNVAVCAVCHSPKMSDGTTPITWVTHNANTGSTTFRDFVTGSTLLADIDTAKKTLLGFFGNPAFFFNYNSSTTPITVTSTYGGTDTAVTGSLGTHGAVQACTTAPVPALPISQTVSTRRGTFGATWAWKKDWDFAGTTPSRAATVYMTVKVQQALWNFKLFSEDRSNGVHNPKYAAELLYDAINLINTDTGAGGVAITGAFTTAYPTGLPNISRP